MKKFQHVTKFARAATPAVRELVAQLPDDAKTRLAEMVARGGRLALGIVGDEVSLDLVDDADQVHRIVSVNPEIANRH